MKKNIYKILIFLLSTTSFSSCTYLFAPKKQSVEFLTGNKDAQLYLDGVKEGKGKRVEVKKLKKEGMKQVTVRVPEHKDFNTVIMANKKSGTYWVLFSLDVLTFPFVYNVYMALLPMAHYFDFEEQINVKNNHVLPIKKENQKQINFIGATVDINDNNNDYKHYYVKYTGESLDDLVEKKKAERLQIQEKELKKRGGKELLSDSEEKRTFYKDSQLSRDILKTLKNGGFIDTTGNVLINKDNTLYLESKIVGGHTVEVFNKNMYKLSERINPTFYSSKLNIDWFVKNQYNQIIDSIRVSEYSDFFLTSEGDITNKNEQKALENALIDAVNNSFLKLYGNETFLKHLEVKESIVETLPLLTLRKPNQIVKNQKEAMKAAVIIKNKNGKSHGSGFAISNDGYIITNFHVVAGKKVGTFEDVSAILPNGQEVNVKIVRVDPLNDLALLKVEESFEKAFLLSSTKSYDLLESICTVGSPVSVELGNSLTVGVLSAERNTDGIEKLQLNMNVSPGNSGGPVFTTKTGVLHGVISSKLVGNYTEGIAFAIPSYNIMKNLSLEIK